jgi:hypothetical protein
VYLILKLALKKIMELLPAGWEVQSEIQEKI